MTPLSVQAQQQPAGDLLAAQVTALVASDTAPVGFGHTDFARYTTVDLCLVAVRHEIIVARRSIAAQEARDTVRRDPVHDTLPAGVIRVAHGCAARFPVATMPAAELPALFDLALLGQNDSLAGAVLARQRTLAATTTAQTAVLAAAVDAYLGAEPARLTAAEALVARLDAMGASDAVLASRLQAHQRLLAFDDSTSELGRMRREAEAILTLTRAVPLDRRGTYASSITEAYRALVLLAYLQAPDSVSAVVRQLQTDTRGLPGLGYASFPLDTLVRKLSPFGDWVGLGRPTPPLQADFWFPAKDTVPPGRGRVSLYVELPAMCYDSYNSAYVLHPIETGCQRTYDLVRGWHARYGGAGLDMTLVAATTGLEGTVLSGPQTPAEAAKNLAWYVQQYLKLPVQHVAVQIIPLTAPLPAPDGRVFPQAPYEAREWGGGDATPFQQVYHAGAYRSGGDAAVVLTDRDGRYLYGGGPSLVFAQLFARVMATRAVATPTASRAQAPPGPGAPVASPAQSGTR